MATGDSSSMATSEEGLSTSVDITATDLVAVVLDLNPWVWSSYSLASFKAEAPAEPTEQAMQEKAAGSVTLEALFSALLLTVGAISAASVTGVPLGVCIVGVSPTKASILLKGAWPDMDRTALWSAMVGFIKASVEEKSRPAHTSTNSLVAAGLSLALCYINKNLTTPGRARCCIIEAATTFGEPNYASEAVPLANCGWAAQDLRLPIDLCTVCPGGSLHSGKTSPANSEWSASVSQSNSATLLVQLCEATRGVHIPSKRCSTVGGLFQSLMFHFSVPSLGEREVLKTRPSARLLEMGSLCACHGLPVDRGYVCSVCLCIYCNDSSGVCRKCGARFKRFIAMSDTLLITGLPKNVEEQHIRAVFAGMGLLHVRLDRDSETQKPTGYAFIRFASPGLAAEALEKRGGSSNSQGWQVTMSARPDTVGVITEGACIDKSYQVYIGNLFPVIDSEKLTQVFKDKYEGVRAGRVIRTPPDDQGHSDSLGYGFVAFDSSAHSYSCLEEVDAAMK
ncbi:hypothetical protein FOZ63_026810, partial [Perkinsus olseni]